MQAEEMDASISELARVSGGERALVEECGHLLFKTYTSQVSLPLILFNLLSFDIWLQYSYIFLKSIGPKRLVKTNTG